MPKPDAWAAPEPPANHLLWYRFDEENVRRGPVAGLCKYERFLTRHESGAFRRRPVESTQA